MSLLIWLPFTNGLINQGNDDATFSYINNNGKLSNSTDGKLGNCYQRTAAGYADCIRSSKNFNLSEDISMACWARVISDATTSANGLITNHNHVTNSGVGITVKQISSTDYRISCNTGTGSSRTYNTYYGTTNIKDAWHHLALTYSKSRKQLLLYVDGNVEYTLNNYTNGSADNPFDIFNWSTGHYTSSDYRPVCKLNDVRLYDNELSAKEIKGLAKGLIIHLPLNDLIGNDNLLKNSTQGAGISQTTYNLQDYNFSKALVAGTTYTITCKINMSDEKKSFAVYHSGGSIICGPWIVNTGSGVYTWSFEATSQMASQTAGGGYGYARVYVSNNNGPQGSTALSGTANVDWIKIEEGTASTGFIPNSADALYNTLGLNSGIVHDISGYVHNGTMSATKPTVFTNSARYSAAMTFANSVYISIPIPSATGFGSSYTFSWWGKCTAYEGKMYWGFSNGNRLNLYGYNGNYYWNTGDGSSNPFSGATFAGQIDNNWHHFAVTGDGTTAKLYIDGVFKANAKTFKAITGTNIILNGWDTGNSYNFNGQLSDFRLYATALSAADIMDLYNKPVSIDNTGKVHAIEYREV